MNAQQSSIALHRRLVLEACVGVCTAAVEDDFHHFIVTLRHDGDCVTSIEATTTRSPWTLCSEAAALLPQFLGQALADRTVSHLQGVDSKQHCTHQYDLAVLAMSHALREGRREYLVTVTDPQDRCQRAQLWRDGQRVLDWQLQRTLIASQDVLNDRDLRDVMAWAVDALDNDMLEALYVLRRAVMVSGGRMANLDRLDNASQAMKRMAGGCYVFQPERAEHARSSLGSTRKDLHDHAGLLTNFGPPAQVQATENLK